MARRYDSRTTIFSPEGRLYQVLRCCCLSLLACGQQLRTCDCLAQVEYAIEAISHAGSAVGIMCAEGVVLAAEKKILSKVRGVETRRRCQCRLLEACLAAPHLGRSCDAALCFVPRASYSLEAIERVERGAARARSTLRVTNPRD